MTSARAVVTRPCPLLVRLGVNYTNTLSIKQSINQSNNPLSSLSSLLSPLSSLLSPLSSLLSPLSSLLSPSLPLSLSPSLPLSLSPSLPLSLSPSLPLSLSPSLPLSLSHSLTLSLSHSCSLSVLHCSDCRNMFRQERCAGSTLVSDFKYTILVGVFWLIDWLIVKERKCLYLPPPPPPLSSVCANTSAKWSMSPVCASLQRNIKTNIYVVYIYIYIHQHTHIHTYIYICNKFV